MDGIAAWEARWRPFEIDESLHVDFDVARRAIDELTTRLHDNYPFFHPDYAGQMLKPPHPVALAAYLAAARINPNNHALDGGPATAALEREVVAQLATMFGYGEHLGHLTSSGTIANLEALWVSSKQKPGKAIAFSSEAHYTHARMCSLLGVETIVIPVDRRGKMDLGALRDSPAAQRIGTVVVTAGTTPTGALDPLREIVELARERSWRVHCDAAYGGFYALLASVPEARMDPETWHAIAHCDCVVVDPHKHGLQPYGCGCVIFRDPAVAALYKHDSPATYFSSKELHLGEISLECSRAGAAAAALWVTLRCLPLHASDGLGAVLLKCRRAALRAHAGMLRTKTLAPIVEPELDIVTFAPGPTEGAKASEISARTERMFQRAMDDSRRPTYLAKWRLPEVFGRQALPGIAWDEDGCTVLRSVLLKPEHEAAAQTLVDGLANLLN
jgi:glutamate/tyrosine decarboxylase-like PLP-dependent enzyme